MPKKSAENLSKKPSEKPSEKSAEKKLKVGVVGASGYTGAELLRLLAAHPQVQVAEVTSRQYAGRRVGEIFPNLYAVDWVFSAPETVDFDGCDAVFFATPHGVCMQSAGDLLARGVKIIDFSGDFRLRDAEMFARWYGMAHAAPDLLAEAVYGLPELFRESLKSARLIANPGCYPTAVQLGFAPLLRADWVAEGALIADVKSGVSGAGRGAKVDNLYAETAENFRAYALNGHRHQPEIEQGLSQVAGRPVRCVFVPHLVPMIRGIEATLYAPLKTAVTAEQLQDLFAKTWENERFIRVLPQGQAPQTRHVRGTNQVAMGVSLADGGRLAVISVVEDNLIKGAAGQAVQAMNAAFGLPEDLGLAAKAVFP